MSSGTACVRCSDLMKDFDDLLAQGCKPIPTGMMAFDEALGGGVRDYFMVVGGKAGVGKTDVGCTMSASIALARPVMYVTFELTIRQLLARLVPACAIRAGVVDAPAEMELYDAPRTDAFLRRYDDAVEAFNLISGNVYMLDQTCLASENATPLTVRSLRALVEKFSARDGVAPAVVIDYLQQFVEAEDQRTTTTDALDYLARQLAAMAHSLETPVVALSSLGKDGRLRGSSHIEHAADVAVMVRQVDCISPDAGTVGLELDVTKYRYGRERKVTLEYRPAHHYIY